MQEWSGSVAILGSTGSIGTQALRVARALGRRVTALSARRNIDLLEQQARAFMPQRVCIMEEEAYALLKTRLADTGIQVLCGMEGLCEIAGTPGDETILNAVVGMVGLRPTLCALHAGKTVALANKETLVAGGALVKEAMARGGASLLPVDSEHSAIFQCLCGNDKRQARRILLTASGGPFFGRARRDLAQVRPCDALKHPNWSMGAKITIDSATMMNKGLELIEAMWLFDMQPQQIEILVHRQSIVHSAVEYCDGCMMAQLGAPDMALPIQYALTYPQRVETGVPQSLDLFSTGTLTFERPDEEVFGCLSLARGAAQRGGLAPCILNAANEAAVELFLQQRISFLQIEELVRGALDAIPAAKEYTLDDVQPAGDAAARYVRGHA